MERRKVAISWPTPHFASISLSFAIQACETRLVNGAPMVLMQWVIKSNQSEGVRKDDALQFLRLEAKEI